MKKKMDKLQKFVFPTALALGVLCGLILHQPGWGTAFGSLVGIVLHFVVGWFGLK